jgi:nicotinamide phosphoribosyltransferase
MFNPLMYTDFYKTDHRRQYPEGTEIVYSNFTARGSRIDSINSIVVFGIQYFIKKYLIEEFNNGFFRRSKSHVIAEYKRRLDSSLGKDSISLEHIEALHDLGYLPIEIKALSEGSICPLRVPCLTIINTKQEFYWVTNFLETLLSNTLWGMMTSATIAHKYKELLNYWAKKTSDIPEFVDFQGHDFSMRGMWNIEAAAMSGAAHLLSFLGTDTIPAIDFLEKYYNASCENNMIGCSVPATEHSVMCLNGDSNEIDLFQRLITKVYPSGIVSIVSDTWDYWKVICDFLPKLKKIILKREGKVVIRPDSGDPVKIICGNEDSLVEHERSGSVQKLWDIFGGTINSKGYKQLNEKIGLIYGDSITLERANSICKLLEQKGFASTNIVFGIGSYTYQYNTRDTFGFAVKSTYGVVNGEGRDIYKRPKTDDGLKNSAKGLLCVTEGMILKEKVSIEEEKMGLLETVFRDGKLFREESLEEIKDRLKKEEKER